MPYGWKPTENFGLGSLIVGYTYLESAGTVDNESAMFLGSNVGFQIDLGVDYFLTRNFPGFGTGYSMRK